MSSGSSGSGGSDETPAAPVPTGRLSFRVGRVREAEYLDGSIVPALRVGVERNGIEVAYADLHAHKNSRGISIGLTAVVYHAATADAGEGG